LMAFGLFLSWIIVLVATAMLEIEDSAGNASIDDPFSIGILIASGVVRLIVCVIIHHIAVGVACPHCSKWLAGIHQGSQDLGSETGFKTVSRHARNRNGDIIRSWDEQVLVRRSYWRDFYVCR